MTPDTAAFDWSDAQTRRRLTTALIEIIYAHAPDGADVVELALHTPSLTFQEVEVVKAYFRGSAVTGIHKDSTTGGGHRD